MFDRKNAEVWADIADLPDSFVIEELERMRREQEGERSWPALEMPLPVGPMAPRERRQPEAAPRVIIIDI